MELDGALLSRIAHWIDFLRTVIVSDTCDDWSLAKDTADLLVQLEPESFIGHTLLVRCHRHLGISMRPSRN